MATRTSTSDTYRNWPWVRPIPFTAITLMTTIRVLTASE